MQPYIVYYLHYEDFRFMKPAWNLRHDYSCCVMADSQEHAMEKTKKLLEKIYGQIYISFKGIATGKVEWVDEENPLGKNDIMPLGNRPRPETN